VGSPNASHVLLSQLHDRFSDIADKLQLAYGGVPQVVRL
jgi:hypothetical protein